MKNHYFENDNGFYDENQKYIVKLHDFCAPVVGKNVKFSQDFNVRKKKNKNFFAKFACFLT